MTKGFFFGGGDRTRDKIVLFNTVADKTRKTLSHNKNKHPSRNNYYQWLLESVIYYSGQRGFLKNIKFDHHSVNSVDQNTGAHINTIE